MHWFSVTIHVEPEPGAAHFRCPNCDRKISYRIAYPLSFLSKPCPGCKWKWFSLSDGIGPWRRDVTEPTAYEVAIASRGI